MNAVHPINRKSLAGFLVALSIASILFLSLPTRASAAPTGANMDHVVIIAMENQHYSNVLGNGTLAGCPTGTAPFLCSMLPFSTTIPRYHSDGAGDFSGDSISGCSAACYVAFMAGSTYSVSDGYSCCLSGTTFVDQMQAAGLTWQAYCESGCPRGNDHFPFTGFSSDHSSPNIFTSSSVSTTTFISAANSANPPNLLWFTPTDQHNMHSVSISTGDLYLKSFLVGSGSISTPSSGSLLASNLFTNPTYRTLLYLWWDEYDPSPNILYGPNTGVKPGYVSPANTYDEYASLHTLENNWGLPTLLDSANAPLLSDIFGTTALSTAFTFLPLNPVAVNTTVSFTGIASGGTPPYKFAWDFGDGYTSTGPSTTHTYLLAGNYTVKDNVTDSHSLPSTVSSAKSVIVENHPTGPHLVGWGGIRLADASGTINATADPSAVFPGKQKSDLERLIVHIAPLGYNAVRISFAPYCSFPTGTTGNTPYTLTDAQNTMAVASYYHFWVILRYDSDSDINSTTTCWLNYWQTVITQTGPLYSQIIWEPINEPAASVAALSTDYQLFISMARSVGDQHWIVIENQCSHSCPFSNSNIYQGYPIVVDTLGKVLISFHLYYSYKYNSAKWTDAGAEAAALNDYNQILLGHSRTGWWWLNTEGGPDVGLSTCNGSTTLPSTSCSPDSIVPGSSGWSPVTLTYIRTMTRLFNANNPPISWLWWPVGIL